MRSYFVRHTQALRVRDEDLKVLWNGDCIAVHYPDSGGVLEEQDSRSTDPENYTSTGKTAMRYLRDLSRYGGYVWTESFVSEDGVSKIGVVKPSTEIQLHDAHWDLRDRPGEFPERRDGDPAVLKALKLLRTKLVGRREQVGLRAGRPRQGTIARWNCGSRLEDLVEGRRPKPEWANLSTAQQEAACAEFLRADHSGAGLPRLRRLLLPVGRTLQDVDLHGLAEDGQEVFAQVTYYPRGHAEARKKAGTLESYGRDGAHLVLFCRGGGSEEEGGIKFVTVEDEVLNWILEEEPPGYREVLFG